MRLVIQRVLEASVKINQQLYSSIGPGLLVLLGIHREDQIQQVLWCVNKLTHLRIFSDAQGKMNVSLKEAKGHVLVVSQFTLYGNCLGGRRPDFLQAAPPAQALPLYHRFIDELKREIEVVQTGEFGADMQVSLTNDGPVTLLIESEIK
ncbi:D-aminoacyl-tRNA deacylase [Candidatus Protochlamydia phocaeensis]|uniref:D-aminoacyl-tRNA deacylase n=1 Tax=Candidatus Protochlamydia phocaeensis TaxID=1414722 RepID=UPI0008382C26|nr:D-aminoacyl-tRNA deacylase [Candidatus Protochlamydia phocaeensis]